MDGATIEVKTNTLVEPKTFPGRLPNDDVEETAGFIDKIGLNAHPDMFAAIARQDGWSMGLSPAAIQKLNLGNSTDPDKPVYLRILAVNEGDSLKNMIAYQEIGEPEEAQQKVVGLIDNSERFYPITEDLVISGADSWLQNGELTPKLDVDKAVLMTNAFTIPGGADQLHQESDLVKDRVPNVSEAQYILCMNAVEAGRYNYDDIEELKKILPWPQSEDVELEIKQAWERIDGRDLHNLTREAIARMPTPQRAEAARFLVDNWQVLSGPYEEGVDAYRLAFSQMDVNDPEMVLMGGQLRRLVSGFDFDEKWPQGPRLDAMDVIEDIEWNGYQSLIYRSIPQELVGNPDVDRAVGHLMRWMGMASELNVMRGLLDQNDLPDSQRAAVGNMVKRVLGFWGVVADNDAPVHTSLDQLYESIKFEEYKVSLDTAEPRRRMLVELMDSLGIPKSARLLDLGSGTGWMTNALRESKYSQTYGIDYSRRHIQVAREAYGNYYAQGDWYKLAEEVRSSETLPDQMDVILSMGRSLPHTEDEEHFLQVLDQVRGTLDEDGLFVFDMPDSEVGSYQANVQAYRRVLEGFGYTPEELADTWIVVDSPDGKNFFNRYTPPMSVVKELLTARGFELLELNVEGAVEGEQGIIREELPNGKGDANIVYACRKKKYEPIETSDIGRGSREYGHYIPAT